MRVCWVLVLVQVAHGGLLTCVCMEVHATGLVVLLV